MSFQELLHNTLLKGTSSSSTDQSFVSQQSEQWERENAEFYLQELATYLGDESKPESTRFLAGIMLKNSFSSENASLNEVKQERWAKGLSGDVKVHIRERAYTTLASTNVSVRKAAAQVIGKIGVLDLNGEWPDLMKMLMEVTVTSGPSESHKLACVDSIGYICEEGSGLENFSDSILTSVIHNIQEGSNPQMMNAALKALRNALPYCSVNFERAEERSLIVAALLRCATSGNDLICLSSFGVLIDAVASFYHHMSDQMEPLFGMTLSAIRDADEEIAKYAIEFWNTVCEIETDLQAAGEPCFNFANSALKEIVPVLCASLAKQDDPEYDSDDFTLPIAASVSLKFFAQSVKEEIIPHLMPFIEQNIKSQNWNLQDASLLSLIAVLECPEQSITQIVDDVVPILLKLLESSNVPAIRDNAAWTLGQIIKVHPDGSFKYANDIFNYMGNALQNDSPRIATHACWTIHNMAESYGAFPESPVIKHFGKLFEVLLLTGDRTDATEYNLRSSAYETIILLLLLAPDDCEDIYIGILVEVLNRLKTTFSNVENLALAEASELCCGVIQVVASRLGEKVFDYAEQILTDLVALLGTANGKQVSHDAFLAITAIEQAIGEDFIPYVSGIMPFIFQGLKNWEDSNACNAATDLVSDIANILEDDLCVYTDQIMELLLENMKQTQLDRMIKPTTIRCFGDISMSLGSQFSRYSSFVLEILNSLTTVLNMTNFDDIEYEDEDYVDSIRTSLFDTYAAIATNATQNEKDMLAGCCKNITDLLNITLNQEYRPLELSYSAWGLLGDLIGLFQKDMKALIDPSLKKKATVVKKTSQDYMEIEVAERVIQLLASLSY